MGLPFVSIETSSPRFALILAVAKLGPYDSLEVCADSPQRLLLLALLETVDIKRTVEVTHLVLDQARDNSIALEHDFVSVKVNALARRLRGAFARKPQVRN